MTTKAKAYAVGVLSDHDDIQEPIKNWGGKEDSLVAFFENTPENIKHLKAIFGK